MKSLLEARRVSKVFRSGLLGRRETVALDGLSLTIFDAPPSITAVAGESGSGKTTLARLLLGFTSPTKGEVLYQGRALRRMSAREYRTYRREVQTVFQDPFDSYNPFYRVDHVLAVAVDKFKLARSKAEARQRIEDALQTVGLRPDETLGRFPHQLSGGQRQRVMVARAVLMRPRVILADEPVSMVDASLRATILSNLRKLNREMGISLLYITHDLATAYQIAENIVVLYGGSVMEAGDVEEVIGDPKHPYTRLLVDSVPVADSRTRWADDAGTSRQTPPAAAPMGCKFAHRCPQVMPVCREKSPPAFQVGPHRAVSCFLFQDSPGVSPEDLVGLFRQQSSTQEGHTSGTRESQRAI